jgi:hypothetical protein
MFEKHIGVDEAKYRNGNGHSQSRYLYGPVMNENAVLLQLLQE